MELLRNTASKIVDMGPVLSLYWWFRCRKISSEGECPRIGIVRLFCSQPKTVNHIDIVTQIVPLPAQNPNKTSQIYIVILKIIYVNI